MQVIVTDEYGDSEQNAPQPQDVDVLVRIAAVQGASAVEVRDDNGRTLSRLSRDDLAAVLSRRP